MAAGHLHARARSVTLLVSRVLHVLERSVRARRDIEVRSILTSLASSLPHGRATSPCLRLNLARGAICHAVGQDDVLVLLRGAASQRVVLRIHPKVQYPTAASDYVIKEEIGRGVSAKVYCAECVPLNETVAVKMLDLEDHDPGHLEEIRREVASMSMVSHPNLVMAHCSFVEGQFLWVVMPFLSGGSALNIMKWSHPKGLDEASIATILKEVLKALDYFHRNGNIHRDIKAGNILIDHNGSVKLADAASRRLPGAAGRNPTAPSIRHVALLDGAGGDGTGDSLRLPRGHLVAGHHRAGAVPRPRAVCQVPADEGVARSAAEPAASARG